MELQGYTIIPDWMLDIELDVYETIILGVIYGFSQDEESTFKGSIAYLSKKARCSRAKTIRALAKLKEAKLIQKIDVNVRGVHLCEYRVTRECTMYTISISQTPGSISQTPNNIVDNIEDINTSINRESKSRTRFQKPSIDEIRAYCSERHNTIDAQTFFDFYESKGWMVGRNHMKDWKASIRTWERSRSGKPSGSARQPKESVFEHNLKVMDEMYGTNLHEQAYGK